MFRKFGKSVLAKLIAVYILMAFLLIFVLGLTFVGFSKQEILNMRVSQLSESADIISSVASQSYNDSKTQLFLLMQSMANEYNGVIQIYDTQGAIVSQFGNKDVSFNKDALLDQKALQVVRNKKRYIIIDYFNNSFDSEICSVIEGVYGSNGDLLFILALHSDSSGADLSYSRMIGRFWMPCVAVIGLCIVLIILINYSITTPLVEMNSIVHEIRRGNYDKQVMVTGRDEVGQLAENFNEMAEQLKNTDTINKDFVANISHELRTPLTSINGFVQGILDGTISEQERDKYLNIVLVETQRLSKLTREMLDLSRIESGKYTINKTAFDINELIRRVIITLGNEIDKKNIDINVDFAEERILVYADQGCIEQVCVNILDNAIKFSEDNKSILISTKINNGSVQVSIRDFGKGISQLDLKHIWNRFYTENKSRSGNKGMGLGLSIVKRLLAEHGKDINVESEVGKGTCFWFELEQVQKNIKKS